MCVWHTVPCLLLLPLFVHAFPHPTRTPHVPPHHCGHLQELELLLMQNRKYCAEIASAVSASKRREIVLRAEPLHVRVTHAHAKLREEENE